MPIFPHAITLCRYYYDPLDRLVDCTAFEQSATRRFYCKNSLANEIQGAVQRTIVQHDNQLLAQQQRENSQVATTLLVTDHQRSILNALDANQPNPLAYTPYGHRPAENGLLSLLGFNGERPDPVTGHYDLGKGYRQFNPVLMRFNSPDRLSPFGEDGLNAYAYCSGDPVNFVDPTGRTRLLTIAMRNDYIKSALNHSKNNISKKIYKKTKILAKTKYANTPGQKKLTTKEKVGRILEEKTRAMLDESGKIENRLISEGKMIPMLITDNPKMAKFQYDRLDLRGIPSTKNKVTKTGKNGAEILITDQFDAAFSYFHTNALAGGKSVNDYRELAGMTLTKRAEYIRLHSEPAK